MTTKNQTKKIDALLLIGASLSAATVFVPVGVLMIFYGLHLERKEIAAGRTKRPIVLTALAVWGMSNGFLNLFSAHAFNFAPNNQFFKPLVEVYGTVIDYRYWLDGYNTETWEGVADHYETTWNIITGFMLFPIYTVANYGLYRMKSWGLQFTIIFSWIFAFQWFHYLCHHTLGGNANTLGTPYPVWGWMVMNYPYLTPVVAIPYLHCVNRNAFQKEGQREKGLTAVSAEPPATKVAEKAVPAVVARAGI
ncbi:MAG: hypothetical protein HRU17_20895 [Polyangiaceae bacterium]|nr:hypothetical protein [Polyangiaceae bacterium]